MDELNGFVIKLLVKGEQGILENCHGKEARATDSLVAATQSELVRGAGQPPPLSEGSRLRVKSLPSP